MSNSAGVPGQMIPSMPISLKTQTIANFSIKQDLAQISSVQLQGDTQKYFQLLEEREENARKIWNKIRVEINKRRSGKIKTYFPVMRIKTIMKLDPEVGPVSRDAAAAISFIAEMFIHELSSLAWIETEKRRMTVMGRLDIHQAIRNFDHFDFLADVIPYWKYSQLNSIDLKGRNTGRKGNKCRALKKSNDKAKLAEELHHSLNSSTLQQCILSPIINVIQPSFSSNNIVTRVPFSISPLVEPMSFPSAICDIGTPSVTLTSASVQPFKGQNNCQHGKLSLSVNEVSCLHCGAIIRSF